MLTLCLGIIDLMVAPWKFDVLKTSVCFKSIWQIFKFPRGKLSADPRQKRYIA